MELRPNKDLSNFYHQVSEVIFEAKKSISKHINLRMVYTYFEIGKMIVEQEQKGKKRAKYGEQLLKGLSKQLQEEFNRGFSVYSLENMRKFYLVYKGLSYKK